MSGEVLYLAQTIATVGRWVMLAMAVTLVAHYWADSKYPLAVIQVPLLDWFYNQDPTTAVVPQEALDIGGATQWVEDSKGERFVRATVWPEPIEERPGEWVQPEEETYFFRADGDPVDMTPEEDPVPLTASFWQGTSSTIAKGLECALCSGQWISFGAAATEVLPWEHPVSWLVWALSLNLANGALRHFLWVGDE